LIFLWSDLQQWLDWGLFDRIWNMSLLVLAGGGSYVLALFLLGVRYRDVMAH